VSPAAAAAVKGILMRSAILLLAVALVVASCSPAVVSDPTPSTPDVKVSKKSTAAALGIPPGHLPPPGKCRVWIPGTPPGHQPKAGSCSAVARSIPPGAWLITRLSQDKKHVRVQFYDQRRSGVVVAIRMYDAKTGLFVADLDTKQKYAGK
jgi:hypothetical protein